MGASVVGDSVEIDRVESKSANTIRHVTRLAVREGGQIDRDEQEFQVPNDHLEVPLGVSLYGL